MMMMMMPVLLVDRDHTSHFTRPCRPTSSMSLLGHDSRRACAPAIASPNNKQSETFGSCCVGVSSSSSELWLGFERIDMTYRDAGR